MASLDSIRSDVVTDLSTFVASLKTKLYNASSPTSVSEIGLFKLLIDTFTDLMILLDEVS